MKLNKNWITLFILALAGGLVFKVPYLKYSYYDALISALNVDNTQLGSLVSAFGVSSMIFYFPGGWVADRFSAKHLLSFSFISLGSLALWYATFPAYEVVLLIHVLFGAIITLTYWSVAIKAVRMLSSGDDLGKMFGFWEGGKQVSGLIVAYLTLGLFAYFDDTKFGMATIIAIYGAFLISVGVLLALLLKTPKSNEKTAVKARDIFSVAKDSRAWMFGLLIFTAYHFHIGLNIITPYLTQSFGLSAAMASGISMFMLYAVGSVGSASAGILVDKFHSTLKVLRGLLLLASISMIAYLMVPSEPKYLFVVIGLWGIAQFLNFSVRGIYFSSLGEIGIPAEKSGLFVGFASFVGFIPDTYFHYVTGFIMDTFPGVDGFKIIFGYILVMTVICFGVITTMQAKFAKKNESKEQKLATE